MRLRVGLRGSSPNPNPNPHPNPNRNPNPNRHPHPNPNPSPIPNPNPNPSPQVVACAAVCEALNPILAPRMLHRFGLDTGQVVLGVVVIEW